MHEFAVFVVIGWSMDLAVQLRRPPWRETWEYVYGLVWVVVSFVLTLMAVIQHQRVATIIFAIYTLILGWLWWYNTRNRRRRRKAWDRAAGWVADMGGRLKVIRPA